jgi:SAM-dependent methyltransferase
VFDPVPLHPLAQHFGAIAGVYDRGRPDYSPAAAGAIAAELGLRTGDRVLDLAAGTGNLTRALIAAGLDAQALEPQPELREALAASIGPERVHEGVAEAIPLPDGSVRAVTAAAAFHWFEQPAAIREIERVLAPQGGLVVCENHPDWSAEPWAHEIGTLVFGRRPEHPHFDGPPWHETIAHAGGWSEPRNIRVTTTTPWQPGQTRDFLESMSWVAAMAAPEREEMLEKVDELIGDGEPRELPLHATIGLAQRLAQ